jgi:hypothetical protein
VTIVMSRPDAYDAARDHHHDVGWNGLSMENAWDCFVDGVNVLNADNAMLFTASKNITVRDFLIGASDDTRAVQHHGTITREFSNDILFEDFTVSAEPIHGINVEGFSMGNVWSRGTLEHGTWDLHRTLPVENALTEISIHNDGDAGGRSDAGPHAGARHAVWNVTVDNGNCQFIGQPDMMPSGVINGLRGCEPGAAGESNAIIESSGLTGDTPDPPNLYEAQRAARTCR